MRRQEAATTRRRRRERRRRQLAPPLRPFSPTPPTPRLLLGLMLLLVRLAGTRAIEFDPCAEVPPISKGDPFVVGLAYWPGGLQADWGTEGASSDPSDPTATATATFLHPCNATHRAALAAAGAHFATFSARADRLAALKTTFPEELFLTGANPNATAPRVISVVAFRHKVRSEPRYVASFDSQVTAGTGFVGSLSLVASFNPPGELARLLWWNLTCNDCGGGASARCLDGTACAVPAAACTCSETGGSGGPSSPAAAPGGEISAPSAADAAAAPPPPSRRRRRFLLQGGADAAAAAAAAAASPPPPSPEPGTCDYGSMSVCATAVNLAFDGADAKSRAFTTAAAVRNLNSYSLLRLYSAGKDRLFAAADAWSGPVGDAWGKFRAAQTQLQSAYTEGDSGRVTGGAATMVG